MLGHCRENSNACVVVETRAFCIHKSGTVLFEAEFQDEIFRRLISSVRGYIGTGSSN